MFLLYIILCPYMVCCYGKDNKETIHVDSQSLSDFRSKRTYDQSNKDRIWKLRFRPENSSSVREEDNPFGIHNIEQIAKLFSDVLFQQFESKTRFADVAGKLRYVPYDVTGGYDTLSIVSEHVEKTLWKAKGMLLRLRTEAQKSFGEFQVDNVAHFDFLAPSANHTVTKNTTVKYNKNSKFFDEVNLENSSISLPLDVYFNWTDIRRTVQWTQGLDTVFTNNLVGSPIGFYQHFSTPEGLMRSYPSLYHRENIILKSYDPRQKTWYSTGSMEPKSIVFLIDGSGSIFGEARRLLKETAKNVLHSLVSDLDYIDIAVFRDNVTSIFNCNEAHGRLRRTTQAAKSYLIHHIEHQTQWFGVSNFTNGFKYAFDMLQQKDITTCHKLIVLFTDYTNEDLIPYIEERDQDNDGETHVVIFTFGYEGWIRRNLSEIAEHFEGYAVKIKNLPQIFTAARGITNVFARKGLRESTVQFPFSNSYVDGWGQGYIVTLLLPVLSKGPAPFHFPTAHDGSFLGVAGIDLPTGMFGEYKIANRQGCHMQAVNARGYVVYHPLFKQIVMEELDVKYHQFRFIVNSTNELDIENNLVYQNFSGTMETRSSVCDTKEYFRSRYITKYVVFMNPIQHSDFSLALFCPNTKQLTKSLDDDLKGIKLVDVFDGVKMNDFTVSYHCRFDELTSELEHQGELTVTEFYNYVLESKHYDCADTLLQVLYETYILKKIDLLYGSFVIMSTGNLYNKDRMLERYSDDKTTVLYSMITAISRQDDPIVVLEDGPKAFVVARTVYHSTGIPMAVVGYNMTAFSFKSMAEHSLSTATLQRNYMYILDHSGHIVYTNRDGRLFGKFIGHVEPCAMKTLHREGVFHYHEEGQCFHVCERPPITPTSSSSIQFSNFIKNCFIVTYHFTIVTYKFTVLTLYSLFQVEAVSGHEKLQCCKYTRFYQKDDVLPQRAEIYRNGCLKYFVSPIKDTNLLILVTPRDSRCRCILDPMTLQSPPPTFPGPCTMDDRNYNARYECSEEIEHRPAGCVQATVLSRVLSIVMILKIVLCS